MKSFVNKPGMKKESFNDVPFDENPKNYRTTQYYIQALLRKFPDDIERLTKCPEEEDSNSWIYGNFRQFLMELNYFAYAHKDVSTGVTMPKMSFKINGIDVDCRTAAKNPPAVVPAIDYITETIDMATVSILDQKLFPSGVMTEQGLGEIKTFMRRLYRVFSYSYVCHFELFQSLEEKTHLCERFTTFAKRYDLLAPQDIHIPDSYWENKKSSA